MNWKQNSNLKPQPQTRITKKQKNVFKNLWELYLPKCNLFVGDAQNTCCLYLISLTSKKKKKKKE